MIESEFEREFASLPPEARKQVVDFIAFLRGRVVPSRPRRSGRRRKPLDKEPFFGMWRDREDMKDAAAWVRGIRKREWHERAE